MPKNWAIMELKRKDQHKENPLANILLARNIATLFLSIGFVFSSCFTAAIFTKEILENSDNHKERGGSLPSFYPQRELPFIYSGTLVLALRCMHKPFHFFTC